MVKLEKGIQRSSLKRLLIISRLVIDYIATGVTACQIVNISRPPRFCGEKGSLGRPDLTRQIDGKGGASRYIGVIRSTRHRDCHFFFFTF
jgi:hypothetical protein